MHHPPKEGLPDFVSGGNQRRVFGIHCTWDTNDLRRGGGPTISQPAPGHIEEKFTYHPEKTPTDIPLVTAKKGPKEPGAGTWYSSGWLRGEP